MVTGTSEAAGPVTSAIELDRAECLSLLREGGYGRATVTIGPEQVRLVPVGFVVGPAVVTLRLSDYDGGPLELVSLHLEGTDGDGNRWSLEAAGPGRDVTDPFQILAEQIGQLGPAAVAPEHRRFVEIRVTRLQGRRDSVPPPGDDTSPTRPGLGTVAAC